MAICMGSAGTSGGVKVNLRDGGVVQMNHAFIICDSIDICKRACGELSQQLYKMNANVMEKTPGAV